MINLKIAEKYRQGLQVYESDDIIDLFNQCLDYHISTFINYDIFIEDCIKHLNYEIKSLFDHLNYILKYYEIKSINIDYIITDDDEYIFSVIIIINDLNKKEEIKILYGKELDVDDYINTLERRVMRVVKNKLK